MKILKIFGIVVGIHVFALVLIFANPGCSSTSAPPVPADTIAGTSAPPLAPAAQPSMTPAPASTASSGSSAAGITFDPNAPATSAPGGSSSDGGVRFTPTRPGTPAAGTLVSEPVVDVTPATTYTVKSGDSLWTIAKRNHITVAELAAANNLPTNSTLRLNQKLLIPGKPASPTVAAAANPASAPPRTPETAVVARSPGKELKHVVKSGETLGAIARMYGVKAGDIAAANHIADPAKIFPGMELSIPGWETPTSKSGKSSQKKSSSGAAKKSVEKTAPASSNVEPPATLPPAAPPQPPPAPLIPIDDSPLKPAPKS